MEKFIREEFDHAGPIGGGAEMLKCFANYVNGRYVTLEGLRQCIIYDKRVIEEGMGIRKRKDLLKKARQSLLSVSRKDRVDEFEERLVRVEDIVAQLVDRQSDEIDWNFKSKPPRRIIL
jgi:hypothetical protein